MSVIVVAVIATVRSAEHFAFSAPIIAAELRPQYAADSASFEPAQHTTDWAPVDAAHRPTLSVPVSAACHAAYEHSFIAAHSSANNAA